MLREGEEDMSLLDPCAWREQVELVHEDLFLPCVRNNFIAQTPENKLLQRLRAQEGTSTADLFTYIVIELRADHAKVRSRNTLRLIDYVEVFERPAIYEVLDVPLFDSNKCSFHTTTATSGSVHYTTLCSPSFFYNLVSKKLPPCAT